LNGNQNFGNVLQQRARGKKEMEKAEASTPSNAVVPEYEDDDVKRRSSPKAAYI
jgi:hypothetical protein